MATCGWPTSLTWFQIGNVNVQFSIRVDGLSAIMLTTVTFIGTLIAIYSVGYMHGDPGYPRFFALISLFLFSMTGLVLANNFILLYAFWEGVGLCSYLLIGFWFARPAAAAAARKAFLVTRLGDVGLFLGILMLWVALPATTFDFEQRLRRAHSPHVAQQCLADRGLSAAVHAGRWASRRSFRCTSGCPTPWKARRRSAP